MAPKRNLKLERAIAQINMDELSSVIGRRLQLTYSDFVHPDEAIGWAGVGVALAITKYNPEKMSPKKAYDPKSIRAFLKRKGQYLAMDEMRRAKIVDRRVQGIVKKTTIPTRQLSAVKSQSDSGDECSYDPVDDSERTNESTAAASDFFGFAQSILRYNEWNLIYFHYKCKLSMYHIGIILNMSEARVSQVHTITLEKLRTATSSS